MTGQSASPVLLTAVETADVPTEPQPRGVGLPVDKDQAPDVDLPPALVETLASALARALVHAYGSGHTATRGLM